MANRKVKLSEIQKSMAKRGRDRYADAELASDLKSLKAGEVVVWEKAKVNLAQNAKKLNAEKAKWRNRAAKVALTENVEVTIGWLDSGEMYITLKSDK